MTELNLSQLERALLCAAGAVIVVALLVMWLTAPIGAQRFTQPADQQQLVPGQVDPNGPGASTSWWLQ